MGALQSRLVAGGVRMLTPIQTAALDKAGPDIVRLKLVQYGPRRDQVMDGFDCGVMRIGDVEDWLSEKTREDVNRQVWTLRWAIVAGVAAIVAVIVTIVLALLHK